MKKTVVIGAGIAGASLALELTRLGHQVELVDSGAVGRATDAGAGIISGIGTRRTGDDVLGFSMAAAAHYVRLVHDWQAAGRDTSFYRTAGEFLLALDDTEAERLDDLEEWAHDAVGRFGSVGVGTPERLDRAATASRFPLFAPTAQGVLLPEIGQIDARPLRVLELQEIEAAGSRVISGEASVVVADDGTASVTVDGAPVEGEQVVIAGGAWSAKLLEAFLPVPTVLPQRGQIIHLRLPGTTAHPSANGFRGFYLLSFTGDRLVVGATREDDSGFDTRTTIGGLESVLQAGRDLMPTIDAAELVEVRVGIRPRSADALPIVGRLPGAENLWLASGYGPQGLTLGTFIGKELAAEVDGGTSTIPASFRPERFAAVSAESAS